MKNLVSILFIFITSLSYGQWGYHGQTPINQGLSIAIGNMPGMTTVYKFGRNNAVGVTEEVVWDGGGDYTWIVEPDYIEVYSGETTDTYGGDNAWDVMVYGLDSSGYEQSEYMQLNGTTQVTSQNKFLRVYRAFIFQAGTVTSTNGNNLGDITIQKATGDTILAKILSGNGQTLMCVYTVPKGKTAYVTGYSLGAGQGKTVLFKSKFRNGSTKNHAFTVKDVREIYQSTFIGSLAVPLRVPELTDMFITGQDLQAGEVSCSASFGLILIDN